MKAKMVVKAQVQPMVKRKPLYLEIYIGPTGLSWTEFRLLDKKPDPFYRTRGEGNCLIFKLVDGDFSTAFGTALTNGELIKNVGNKFIQADISKIISA